MWPKDCNLVHGDNRRGKRSVESRCWLNMKSRCYDSKNPNYRNYGARGITVCERWKKSYPAFLTDMGRRPAKHFSLDRINNDGNYQPSNCRWATRITQNNNTRIQKRGK